MDNNIVVPKETLIYCCMDYSIYTARSQIVLFRFARLAQMSNFGYTILVFSKEIYGNWLNWLEHSVWDREVPGSSPGFPTSRRQAAYVYNKVMRVSYNGYYLSFPN